MILKVKLHINIHLLDKLIMNRQDISRQCIDNLSLDKICVEIIDQNPKATINIVNSKQKRANAGISCKQKIVNIGAILLIIFIGIMVATIVLVIIYNQKESELMNKIKQNHTPLMNATSFNCTLQSLCVGVKKQIQQYILSSYQNVTQIQSLLQITQVFNQIPNSKNLSSAELNNLYQDIFRSFQCAEAMIGDGFHQASSSIEALQFQTAEQMQNYLHAIQGFQNQVIMAGTSPYLSCNFSIEPSRRVLQTQDINCGVDMNSTWVLYLFTGISLSPFNSMNALVTLKSELDQLSQTRNGEFLYCGKGSNFIIC